MQQCKVSIDCSKRVGVDCEPEDLALASLRVGDDDTPNSAFVRFCRREFRAKIWNNR